MNQQQRNRYLENSIQTASPAQLLIMLFDGAIRSCKLAIDAIEHRDIPAANRELQKAQAIINEFIITMDKNSELSANLIPLYEYMNRRLFESNTKKNIEPIHEVLGYLTELRETWYQASKSIGSSYSGATYG
ncbi:flagellar export chaperone FliS [Marinicrinis lubricantis]|uniref:Flagellar secretion chaperone FliS n=1 Tax=Marinicrinis lubricantis TaxID=2086470 RepID=A0ABW1IT03_9BACL